MVTSQQGEIDAFRSLSARVGRDPLLVQASSGNTSLKLDGVLWIKASGKWLARAAEQDAFVPVPLPALRLSLLNGEEIRADGASIETAMHAVLPHKIVIHVHSVNAIAWAVRRDGPERAAGRLAGLCWRWIPYIASGLPLAQAIRTALLETPGTNVFILANHGLVVCGDNSSEAEDRLRDVESRLAVSPRIIPLEDDRISARILAGGILYPCQAMFLGAKPLSPGNAANGVITECQRAVLNGLLQVVRRIDESAPVRYLSPCEIAELLNHDAHNYLQCAERNAVADAGLAGSRFKEAAPLAAPAAARAGS